MCIILGMEKLRAGYVVQGYLLEEMIGAGGFSKIYKAKNIQGSFLYGPIVAVKALQERRLERRQIRKFKQEASLLMSLQHEHIVKVYRFFQQEGFFFIFMEYMDTDLRKALEKQRREFSLENVMDIFLKMAQALAYIHSRGIIHKDFNPSNILLSYTFEKVKLCDFGVARKQSIWNKDLMPFGGTKGYIAPERKRKSFDKRADIYGFGKTVENVFDSLVMEKPEGLDFLIEQSIKEDPKERFQSMDEVISLLKYIQQNL